MPYLVELKEGFAVSLDGTELGPPPDRTVAVLVLVLLKQDEEWRTRREVSRDLYPSSEAGKSENALRQTLFRAKNWLGFDWLETSANRIRLKPGSFQTTGDEPSQSVRQWLDHPWLEKAHQSPRKVQEEGKRDAYVDFVRSVESVAAIDKDAARGILIGGARVLAGLRPEEKARLLSLTRPSKATDHLAYEHMEQRAGLHALTGEFRASLACCERLYRMATHQKSRLRAAQSSSQAMFCAIELGEMAVADTWLTRFVACVGKRSLAMIEVIARSAYLWNVNELRAAVDVMLESRDLACDAPREVSLHFWANLSVLAAEAGYLDLSAESSAQASRLLRPEWDTPYSLGLGFSEGIRLMRAKNHQDSLSLLATLLERSLAAGHVTEALYVLEAEAEALSLAGETRRSVAKWTQVESIRHAAGSKLSPRVQARRNRIKALA